MSNILNIFLWIFVWKFIDNLLRMLGNRFNIFRKYETIILLIVILLIIYYMNQ